MTSRAGALAAVALLTVLVGCSAPSSGGGRPGLAAVTSPVGATKAAADRPRTPASSSSARSAPASTPAPAGPTPLPVGPPAAASLPQTAALPRTDDAAFASLARDLWLAVTTGDPRYAQPAFFPEKAYEQVKAIGDPAGDWQSRLWYDFTLDLAAVHRLVSPSATLTRIIVPAQDAQWISPGGCYNSTGYWHVSGARVVYRQGGATRSFGIASLISWRGNWYLVHLGAEVRAGAYGIVDDPEEGPGVAGPSGGC